MKKVINRIKLFLFYTFTLFMSARLSAQTPAQGSISAYRTVLEKKIAELGEPYISWMNSKSSKIPKNFSEQISGLKWPLENNLQNVVSKFSKEEFYKRVFNSIRKLSIQSIDPIWVAIANDSLNTMCGNGYFLDSTLHFNEWSGGTGSIMSGNNDPSLGSYTAGFLPVSVGLNNIMSNCNEHHSIVSYGNDPTLGALLNTTSSPSNAYSFRLGNTCVGNGSEYLAKKFVVNGSGVIKFSYAVVFAGTHGLIDNPSFWVKVYDNLGNPIPNTVFLDPTSTSPLDVIVQDPLSPFFQAWNGINYRDWSCAKIDLTQYMGQTVSIALVTTDCAWGGHYGYAYIDNWCGNCEGSTTGTLDVRPDSCITIGAQIHADYTLPEVDTTLGTGIITLTFYHNGVATGYTLTSPILSANGTYNFTISPDSLPCNGSGYDVIGRIDYTFGSSTYSVYSPDPPIFDGIKPGQNNDMVCCQTDSQICILTDVRLTADTGCCYLVEISNQYSNSYFSGISITTNTLTIANVSSGNNWSAISYQSPTQVVFSKIIGSTGIPLDGVSGFQTLGNICFTGSGADQLIVSFIGPAPQYDTICTKLIDVSGCGIPVDTSCVAMIDLSAQCDSGLVKMKFQIKNNSTFTMRGLTLYSQTVGVTPTNMFIPIADLLPGQTSPYYNTTLIVSNNATSACFFFSACDQNTVPSDQGPYPNWCCMDSIPYCLTIPHCDPCDGLFVTASQTDPSNCCYNLNLINNYYNSKIAYMEFFGIGGTQFALLSGWNILAPVGSSHIKIKAPGGGISPGLYQNFASFCLTGTSASPHTVLINILDSMGVIICIDTLNLDCQLVPPTCANIVNDSLYCSGTNIKYTFYVKNNSPFNLFQIDFQTPDVSIVLDSNHMELNPPIPVAGTGGPYTVTILSIDTNLTTFCMYLTGHNGIYDPIHGLAATECCTDSMGVICLPMIKCGGCNCDSVTCCQFSNMTIPNGITPNDDGKNDVFEILNSKGCNYISIKVLNRWGNMVYHSDDYKNDWKGVNDSGTKLVQGTYFIILELPNGNKKGIYVDIRY